MFAGSRLLLPDLRTLLHWCRNPGGRRDMLSEEALAAEGIAVLRRSGSTEKRRPPVAARGGGAWNDRRSGGTEGSLPCSWVEEGWLPSKRERRSRRRLPGGRSLLPSAMSGEEQGTGDSLPATLDRRSHRRPPGGGGALGRPPKMSSTIAWHREWEPLSWLRTERQRVREPDRDFFFFFFFF